MSLLIWFWCIFIKKCNNICFDVLFTAEERDGPDIRKQGHYLNMWQPRAGARYEVMVEDCVGEERRRRCSGWKRIEREEVCSWLTRGFSLIRWGICRRHGDQPTSYFYDAQSASASISRPFLHPPLPCFQSPGRQGWDVVIYTSVHVCVCLVCKVMSSSHWLHFPCYKVITNQLESLIIDLRLQADICHVYQVLWTGPSHRGPEKISSSAKTIFILWLVPGILVKVYVRHFELDLV